MQETNKTLTRTEITEQYLAHHGIKGQRWGVRRFQNSDGSLTQAGKKRRGVNGDREPVKEKLKRGAKNAVITAKAAKDEAGDKIKENIHRDSAALRYRREVTAKAELAKATPEEAEAFKQKALKSGDANEVLRFKDQLSNQELKNVVERLRNENELKRFNQDNTRTVQQQIKDVTSYVRTGADVVTALKDGYNVVATVANSFGANWPVLDGGKSIAARRLSNEVNEMRKAGWEETSKNIGKYSLDALKTMSQLAGYEKNIKSRVTNGDYVDVSNND